MIYDVIWTGGYLAVVAVLAALLIRYVRNRGSASGTAKRRSNNT